MRPVSLRKPAYIILACFLYLMARTIIGVLIEQEGHAVGKLSAYEIGSAPKDDGDVLIPAKRAYFFHDGEEDL